MTDSARADLYALLDLLRDIERVLHPLADVEGDNPYGIDPFAPPPLPPSSGGGREMEEVRAAPSASARQREGRALSGGRPPSNVLSNALAPLPPPARVSSQEESASLQSPRTSSAATQHGLVQHERPLAPEPPAPRTPATPMAPNGVTEAPHVKAAPPSPPRLPVPEPRSLPETILAPRRPPLRPHLDGGTTEGDLAPRRPVAAEAPARDAPAETDRSLPAAIAAKRPIAGGLSSARERPAAPRRAATPTPEAPKAPGPPVLRGPAPTPPALSMVSPPPLPRPSLEAWASRLPPPGAERRPASAKVQPLRLVEPPVAEARAPEAPEPASEPVWIDGGVIVAPAPPAARHARLGARAVTLDPASAERAERHLRRHFQDRARFRVR
jgi:hypothetical protein